MPVNAGEENSSVAVSSPAPALAPGPPQAGGPVPSAFGLNLRAPTELFPLSVAFDLPANHSGYRYKFRDHTRVGVLRQLFMRVELVSVTASVFQRKFWASNKEPVSYRFRLGVIPDSLAIAGTPGSFNAGGAALPRLVTFATNAPIGVQAVHSWGTSGIDFPPGTQVELQAASVWAPHAAFAVVPLDPSKEEDYTVISVQLDFVVACSSVAFGH